MVFKILILCVITGVTAQEKVRYDNFALYKVIPECEEHLQYLKDLYVDSDGLDFWKAPGIVGDYVSVVAPPEKREEFEHSLRKRSIKSELKLKNIQEAFDAQLYSRKKRDTSRQQLYWTNYQLLDDIYHWFEYLARTHSGIVTLLDVGQSYEGRKILGIKISRGSGRRAFVLQGSQIGADWLSPTVLTYIVDQLINGEDPEVRAASEDFDWHVFPVINPDGFNFTQESVRLWTKNRRPITSTAIGVDLSRNWNSQWGIIGASFNPSDNNFVGLGPFSEIETRLMSRYIESVPDLTGFLSFRSFGQRLIIPFAHTTDPLYNYRDMVTIGRRAMGSLAVRYGTQYLVGTSREVSDGSTGNIADWVKHRFNPTIVATYMLRDNGAWGYTLPVSQILPSCEETFDSLLAILREARFINVL